MRNSKYQMLITSSSVTTTKAWGKIYSVTDFERAFFSNQENIGSHLLKTQGFDMPQSSAALRKLSYYIILLC